MGGMGRMKLSNQDRGEGGIAQQQHLFIIYLSFIRILINLISLANQCLRYLLDLTLILKMKINCTLCWS